MWRLRPRIRLLRNGESEAREIIRLGPKSWATPFADLMGALFGLIPIALARFGGPEDSPAEGPKMDCGG